MRLPGYTPHLPTPPIEKKLAGLFQPTEVYHICLHTSPKTQRASVINSLPSLPFMGVSPQVNLNPRKWRATLPTRGRPSPVATVQISNTHAFHSPRKPSRTYPRISLVPGFPLKKNASLHQKHPRSGVQRKPPGAHDNCAPKSLCHVLPSPATTSHKDHLPSPPRPPNSNTPPSKSLLRDLDARVRRVQRPSLRPVYHAQPRLAMGMKRQASSRRTEREDTPAVASSHRLVRIETPEHRGNLVVSLQLCLSQSCTRKVSSRRRGKGGEGGEGGKAGGKTPSQQDKERRSRHREATSGTSGRRSPASLRTDNSPRRGTLSKRQVLIHGRLFPDRPRGWDAAAGVMAQ